MIDKTKSTPYIEFDPILNKLIINGQSYPENAFNFYEPLTKWVDEYLSSSPSEVKVELNIPYINTSSSKCLNGFFR